MADSAALGGVGSPLGAGPRDRADVAALQETCARIEHKIDELVSRSRAAGAVVPSSSLASNPAAVQSTHELNHVARAQTTEYGHIFTISRTNKNSTISAMEQQTSGAGVLGVPSNQSHHFVASTLPLNWPKALVMRQCWEKALASKGRKTAMQRGARKLLGTGKSASRSFIKDKIHARYMINPDSCFLSVWNLFSLFLLIHDLTWLPYVLAWDIPLESGGWSKAIAWATPTFWSTDIILTFLTGFWRGSELVKNPTATAQAYLRRWLIFDASLVFCDWVCLAQAIDGWRLLRIVGMVRVVRVIRLLRMFDGLAHTHFAAGSQLGLSLGGLFGCILWLIHILACAWYAVGQHGPSDTGVHWTANYALKGTQAPYLESGPLYQYAVALHWATGQISLGSVDIMPTNSMERFVFALAMIIGLLFGGMLVSALSAMMMSYQLRQRDRHKAIRMLHRYLRENDVDPIIAMRVHKQIEQRLARRSKLQEEEVPALSLLSAAVRSEVRFDIQKPHLVTHPMFRLWIGLDPQVMQSVCMESVGMVHPRARDDVFGAGGAAGSAYYLLSGELLYIQHPDTSPVEELEETLVQPGQWLCEAALWTQWTHVGRAEATTSCSVLEIGVHELVEVVSRDMIIMHIASDYCVQFHKRVMSAVPPHAPWPNDLEVPFTDFCDLVCSLTRGVQITIGMHAVGVLAHNERASKSVEALKEEVHSGKSIVVVTGGDNIIRVVSLVALRVKRADGHVFVQVAKWEDSEMKPACQLPGLKRERHELAKDAIQRLFDTKLKFLAEHVTMGSSEGETLEKPSREHRVHTRYIKSICSAELKPDAFVRAPVCGTKTFELMFGGRISASIATATSALDTDDANTLSMLHATPVVVSGNDGDASRHLYAWLSPEMVSALSGGAKDHVLNAWVSTLALPQPEGINTVETLELSTEQETERI